MVLSITYLEAHLKMIKMLNIIERECILNIWNVVFTIKIIWFEVIIDLT